MGPPRLSVERSRPADPRRGAARAARLLARPAVARPRTAPEAGRPVRDGRDQPGRGRRDRSGRRHDPDPRRYRSERRDRRSHQGPEEGDDPMTRLVLNRFAVLAAASVLAMAASSPALAQAPATAAATNATAQAAPRADSAAVEGGEVRYFVHGDLSSGKRPLLILHGAFMSSDAMKPLTDLITDRPLIVVDQRGHGRTGDLPGPITYENLADDAAAVLADAGVPKADVVGYSMGAGAALQLALRHPERVDHLVLASVSF